MKIFSVEGNTQKLDGGAMFGNCPKAVWQKWMTPDEGNRVLLACRARLVRAERRSVLCAAGTGACCQPQLKARVGVQEDRHVLLESLAKLGVAREHVGVAVLSPRHFDPAGGLLEPWRDGAPPRLA